MSLKGENVTYEVKGDQVAEPETRSNIMDRSLFTRKEYLFLVTGILIQAFMYSFEVNLMYNVQGGIVAHLGSSSLISVLPVILQTLSAALVPFYTKVSDVVGRAQALTFAMFFYLVGYVIQGTSNKFLQYALGQISYGIGSTGMLTLTQVLIADTTLLVNRGIVFALWDLPSAINIWTTNPLTDVFTDNVANPDANWRDAYAIIGSLAFVGAIAILVPLWYLQRKVIKKGASGPRKSVGWLLHEYDAIGALLITLGMSLTLLPLILARSYEKNWNDPRIIGMFCGGIVSLILLVIWESRYTDKPIMPMRIWVNPTCFGGLVVMFFMTVMAAMNWQYYTLYLVISRDLTFGDALMLERGYQIAYLVFQLLVGWMMKKFNRVRVFVWVGIIVHTAGIGMMIPARLPTSSDALVVISQTIVGAAGGMANIAASVAVTGVVDRKDISIVVGATQILGSFGSALGGALAGGIWTQYLPSRLEHYVTGPYDEAQIMNDPFYVAGLDPVTHEQVVDAYADSQMLMSIISMSLAVITCGCAFLMKHVDLYNDQKAEEIAVDGTLLEEKQEV
ncbi:hypothetical protein BGZ76_008708 [Entomortierella beljakovae]|nr:hypothetical protein BGZ76_008708 [Entomortierella beljakovae]